jgi:hypothetical protein
MNRFVKLWGKDARSSSTYSTQDFITMEKTNTSSEFSDLPVVQIHGQDSVEGSVEDRPQESWFGTIVNKLVVSGVEMRSLEPVPPEKRTHTKYYNILTLFGGSFLSLLP